jgi:hypothetical protein
MDVDFHELLAQETRLESILVNFDTAEVRLTDKKRIYLATYAPGALARPFKGYQLRFCLLRGELREPAPNEAIFIDRKYCEHEELTDEIKNKIFSHFVMDNVYLRIRSMWVAEAYNQKEHNPNGDHAARNPYQSAIWGNVPILTKEPNVEVVREYILPFKQALETLQVD